MAYHQEREVDPHSPSTKESVITFRTCGEEYLAVLHTCEQFLLSIESDDKSEEELLRVRTSMSAILLLMDSI